MVYFVSKFGRIFEQMNTLLPNWWVIHTSLFLYSNYTVSRGNHILREITLRDSDKSPPASRICEVWFNLFQTNPKLRIWKEGNFYNWLNWIITTVITELIIFKRLCLVIKCFFPWVIRDICYLPSLRNYF